MRDDETPAAGERDALTATGTDDAEATPPADTDDNAGEDPFDESITEELSALIDDGRTYAEAEIAFQKTRAKFAGKNIGTAIGFVVVAIITLHIAILALAVGMVIALEPLVTIWGAIAIVVGFLLLATAFLAFKAKKRAERLKVMFGSSGSGGSA